MTKEKIKEYVHKKIDEIIDEIYTKSLYKYDPLEEIKKEEAKKNQLLRKNQQIKITQ